MRGKPHSEEIRVAVRAALLAGQTIAEAARRYNLPRSTISRIKSELTDKQLSDVGTETRLRLDDLLLDSLAANLKAQRRIVETISEPEYIRKQSASAIAELYGTIADKAVRLLEAASLGQAEDPEAVPAS